MESQQDQPLQVPESAPMQSPAMPPTESKKTGRKNLLLAILVAVLILVGLGAWWLMNKDKNEPETTNNQSQSSSESESSDTTEPTTQLTKVTFTSGLEHKTTATLEYPSGWEVTNSEEIPEGATNYSLKSMVIASPKGHYLHINDRDGLGGYCDPNTTPYKLTKEIVTKTSNLYFHEYETTEEHLNKILILEPEGSEWGVPEHEALTEGQSTTNTCNIFSWSSIGASGVFVTVRNTKDLTSGTDTREGWDDIKDDTEFVKMLESLEAVDKSEN